MLGCPCVWGVPRVLRVAMGRTNERWIVWNLGFLFLFFYWRAKIYFYIKYGCKKDYGGAGKSNPFCIIHLGTGLNMLIDPRQFLSAPYQLELELSNFCTQSHLQGFLPFCTHRSPILHPTFSYSRIQSHIEEFRSPIVAPNSHPRTQQRRPTQERCVRHHLWGQRRWRKAPEKTRWVLTCVCVAERLIFDLRMFWCGT